MSVIRFSKNLCFAAFIGMGSITCAFANTGDDTLGQFIQANLQQGSSEDPIRAFATPAATQEAIGPLLHAKAALVMNAQTGNILYQKNIDTPRSIASISKLMAAMVIMDARLDMDEAVTITEAEIDRLKGTGSRLSIGTTMTRNQMMHLGLMSSENRAIHALARTYPGGMPAFVAAMNAKAQSLGMSSTRFFEPTGLDPRNVSTARDLSLMVRAANEYPKLRAWSTATSGSVFTSAGKTQNYVNSNALVREGIWQISIQKTGYIREAGRSMVLQAKMNRDPIVFVILGSSTSATRVNDARTLSSHISSQMF